MKFSKFNLITIDEDTGKIILFNTLQGNCVEIEDDLKDIIEAGEPAQLTAETLKMFEQLGIVVDDNVDENRIFSYFHDREKFSSDTLNSTVLLTWACNLKCVYCFEGEHNSIVTMNRESADVYIKFIKQYAIAKKVKNIVINLFGGEPMVNIEIGYYILDSIKRFCEDKQLNFVSTIITNGTLITEEKLNRLLTFNCRSIQVTLDGIREIHDARRMDKQGKGTFEKIIETLKLLNRKVAETRSFGTVIRINIDKVNIDETYRLLEYIGKEGLNLTNCTVDFGIVRGLTESCSAYSSNCFVEEEIVSVLYDLWDAAEAQGFFYNIRPMRRWLYCGLYGDNQYTITPDCEVYKCWEQAGDKAHYIGRLDENGNIVDIRYAFYDWMSHNPINCEDCRNCTYLPSCGGGCGIVSYANSSTYHEAGCFKVKGVVEKQLIRYYKKRGELK